MTLEQDHFRRVTSAWSAKTDVERELARMKAMHQNRMRRAADYRNQPELRIEYLASAREIRRWMRPLRRQARKARS